MQGPENFQRGALLARLILFAAIPIFMVAIAIPVVKHTRRSNHAQTCVENLAQLLAFKEKFVLSKDLKPGDAVNLKDLMQGAAPPLKEAPVCPDGGEYRLNAVGVLPSCSIAGHVLPMAGKTRKADPAGELAPAMPTPK